MKKILLTFMLLVGIVSSAWAQVDDVTLVVNGEGVTKDEATTKALRSAIEQAFGVFVSANTEILNDELVKDEVATVSSGNVKKYTELGVSILPNNLTSVTLQATVSVQKLTSYAKSHGSSAEFAGATFAQNVKLAKLQMQNTEKAFIHLANKLKMYQYMDMYDVSITAGNPKSEQYTAISKDCLMNHRSGFRDKDGNWTPNGVYRLDYSDFPYYPLIIDDKKEDIIYRVDIRRYPDSIVTKGNAYTIPCTVEYAPTQLSQNILKEIYESLKVLSINYKDRQSYQEMGIPVTEFKVGRSCYIKGKGWESWRDGDGYEEKFYLLGSYPVDTVMSVASKLFDYELTHPSYCILDNLGNNYGWIIPENPKDFYKNHRNNVLFSAKKSSVFEGKQISEHYSGYYITIEYADKSGYTYDPSTISCKDIYRFEPIYIKSVRVRDIHVTEEMIGSISNIKILRDEAMIDTLSHFTYGKKRQYIYQHENYYGYLDYYDISDRGRLATPELLEFNRITFETHYNSPGVWINYLSKDKILRVFKIIVNKAR